MERNKIYHGKCEIVLKDFPDNCIDSIVTDPPYGLKFMGKKWDYDVPSVEIWQEALRVLKPGGHLLSFGGTRTYHRMVCNIEDAGFEIMPMCGWLYGSGFPKSQNISKMIDKAAGFDRKKIAVGDPVKRMIPGSDQNKTGSWIKDNGKEYQPVIEIPATEEAKQFNGFGTALKPAMEPICMARKPIEKGLTIAGNCLKWGTGGLAIDRCRIPTDENCGRPQGTMPQPMDWGNKSTQEEVFKTNGHTQGRFPANLIIDDSECVKALFPETKSGDRKGKPGDSSWFTSKKDRGNEFAGDSGSAARFFYVAKPSKKEKGSFNKHPTVKPLTLMKYLIRLITPPDRTVLDLFAGSGTTLVAAIDEGFDYIGIEQDKESVVTARKRILNAEPQLF